MRTISCFLVARYIVFGFFTICNAITCSVAAWNLSLVHATKPLQIAIYLIFLGAFSLFFIFSLVFVELLCINPFTVRVWFECIWTTLFWLMQLAGGAALIAIDSDLLCEHNNSKFLHDLCTSERVVLAFTWTCAITLLIYLLALVFIAAFRCHEDPEVWVSDVRSLGTSTARQSSSTTRRSSSTMGFKQRPSVDVYTPHPVQSKPTPISRHRSGLSPGYKIEPFRPVFAAPEQMDLSHSSHLPEAVPLPPSTMTSAIPSSTRRIPALPQEVNTLSVSLGLYDIPREHGSSSYASPNLPSPHVPRQNNSSPAPSPLGDWPRQDIMKQPARHKHKPPPPRAFEFPKSYVGDASYDAGTQRSRRPSGPRPSGESGHRPSALDLPGVSTSFETGR